MSKIYIPEPCHENWGKMSPTEKGRFCAVCTKEVVDFTRKTEPEIMGHLANAEGKTCGLFLPSQLHEQHQLKHARSAWEFRLKKWTVSILAFTGLFTLSKNTTAQKMGKVAIRGDVAYVEDHNSNKSESVIYGQVTDKEGKPVSKADIRILSGNELIADTTTMANGSFRFVLKPGAIKNGTISIYANHDFRYKHIENLSITRQSTRIGLQLEEEIMMLGEVAYVEPQTTGTDSVPVNVCNSIDTVSNDTSKSIQEIAKEAIKEGVEQSSVDSLASTEEQHEEFPENKSSLSEPKNPETKIYPNPGKEVLFVECIEERMHEILIMDLNGKVLYQAQFFGTKLQISDHHLASGVYLVSIISGENIHTHQWIIP